MDKNEFLEICSIYGTEPVEFLNEHPDFLTFLEEGGFFTAPASTKHHGAYEGGLFDHSKNVCDRLYWLTYGLNVQWKRKVSPFIVGMLHDICKYDQYIEQDGKYVYNENTELKGHGDKSVAILKRFFDLTDEEAACIRYHMGAYVKEDWQGFDQAIKEFETPLLTHMADMYAAKIDDR